MVKQINIFLDDVDHERILKVKGNMTWKDFLLKFSDYVEEEKKLNKKKECK